MSNRIISDPTAAGWIEVNGNWVWDDSGAGAGMVISETEPTDKVEGMQWLNPTNGLVLFWDDAKWLQMPGGANGADGKQLWNDDNSPDISYTDGRVSVASASGATADISGNGSVTLDFDTNQNFKVTLNGNVTLANPTTGAKGQSGFITFVQAAAGSTVSHASSFKTANGNGVSLSSDANAIDVVPYIFNSDNEVLLGNSQMRFS